MLTEKAPTLEQFLSRLQAHPCLKVQKRAAASSKVHEAAEVSEAIEGIWNFDFGFFTDEQLARWKTWKVVHATVVSQWNKRNKGKRR